MEHVHVRINEEGTLRNQRYAFSDRFTLITELLQNGRRAGATLIEVSHDPASQTLRVIDDGHGIDDFSKLLTFNESGWNEAVQAEEHPFGAGFSRCLYASARCIVTSRGKRIDFETESALSKAPIAVEAVGDNRIAGTRIELHGVDLPDLASRIEELCKGFAVPIEFNGRPIPRMHALTELRPLATPIGDIHLIGTHSGRHATGIVAYLQGFRVMTLPNYVHYDEAPNVVHLNSQEFLARLPDRDTLIDADVQEVKIREQVRMAWRDALLHRKAQLASAEFVEDFFDVMRFHRHLDLLNDASVLPRQVCERIEGYPMQSNSPYGCYLGQPPAHLRRAQIEQGQVKLVKLDWMDGTNSAKWMLARANGYVVLGSSQLDDGHWIHPYLVDLNEQTVEVTATNRRVDTSIETEWISAEVILCDEVSVRIGEDSVTLTDEGLYHDGRFYIPNGEHSGLVVRQCASYVDGNDRSYESDMNADMDALEHLIRRLRMTNPVEAMRSLLKDLQSNRYPCLHGQTFQVRIEQDADEHAVELIA
ncbi:ATP-binding protein [Zoogloea sp.]|uniref:ATP-binding protein n=1 Tax=Zoogloea sp. TaxID=49181 RepID=UPI0025CFDD5E|nr:ATP-binding protein [Zoogloea sp.]MCK6392687.1 ATP-binding protein [Zoogloea sp.]MCK6407600.1 ATP-binding protein [Thauera sp.]